MHFERGLFVKKDIENGGNGMNQRQQNGEDEPIHGEFTSTEFSQNLIGRAAYAIFHWRKLLLIFGIITTVVLGFFATQLKVTAGFTKMIPLNHEYMKTFVEYQGDFGGADKVLIAVKVKDGTIFKKDVMETTRKITEDVFLHQGR